MGCNYNTILTVVLFFLSDCIVNALCKEAGFSHRSTLNYNETTNYDNNLKVPDSALMLFDRLSDKEFASVRHFGRKQKDNETSSSLCSCSSGVCKCCTGYVMNLFNQKACMKVIYNPGDFAFDVAMSLNDVVLYENTMSGKNPKPVCVSPPRLNNLQFCGKFYNVFFPGRNFHFCLSMYGQWRSYELFNFAFDCLRMGAQGVAMVKPDESGGLPLPNPQGGVDAVVDAGDDDIEDYDENLVRSLFNIFDR